MIKICPECFNVNVDGDLCKTCGYPLSKKVVGNLDHYYLYDAIELYNLGQHAEAVNKMREKQLSLNDNKSTRLIEKFEMANSLFKRGEECANMALDKLRQGDFRAAQSDIKAALSLYTLPRFVDIDQQIQAAMNEKEQKDRARSLFEDSKRLHANGAFYDSIRTLQEALMLSGNNADYSAELDRQVTALATNACQEVKALLINGDFKGAERSLLQILPIATGHSELNQLYADVVDGLSRKATKKRTAYATISLLVVIVLVGFGWFFWQNNQKRNLWQAALTEGTIPAIEAFIQNNPDNSFLPAAIDTLNKKKSYDSTEWVKANLYITSASMQTYLDNVKLIKGLNTARANTIIDSIDWFVIEKSDDAYAFENYINSHPTSQYLELARNKMSEQVMGSERDNLLTYINEYFSAYSNNDLETLMLYFEPITPSFGTKNNIAKADLRQLFENDRKLLQSTSTTIDPSSFKVKKDAQGNFYLIFYADTNIAKLQSETNTEVDQEIVEYFSNAEWLMTLNKNNKIISCRYKVISENQINQ